MYKIKFEIVEGLEGYVIHGDTDTFTFEQAQELIQSQFFASHPYTHTIEVYNMSIEEEDSA